MLNLPKFYTFAVSHYCEKARWTMDYAGITYNEQPLTPVLHVPTLIRLSKNKRNTRVPLLIDGDLHLHGSSKIARWADQKAPEKGLFGKPAKLGRTGKVSKAEQARADKARADVEACIARFDGVGHHVRRFCYEHTLNDRKSVLMILTWASAPAQTALLRLSYPAVKAAIRKSYDISPESAARSEKIIIEQLDEVLQASKKTGYLCGKQLTAADIAVASLLAPIAMPDENPVYRAMRPRAPAAVLSVSEHPAMDWVRKVYQQHRLIDVV